ncbi:MAG: hypothetical protein KAR40_13785 [Candidatus Sabulitectum sp.]|nr:hypothetical protein [Candidatus Sabulitectum sp.]
MSYKQALADHKVLWGIAPAGDMSGGYVDQEDLDRLLKSPTKKTAEKCLIRQIVYWFEVGMDKFDYPGSFDDCAKEHPEILAIKKRYDATNLCW